MPRMPHSQCDLFCTNKPIAPNASDNIKYKILEDKLRNDLVPRDASQLEDFVEIAASDYLYLYNTTTQELGRVQVAQIANFKEDLKAGFGLDLDLVTNTINIDSEIVAIKSEVEESINSIKEEVLAAIANNSQMVQEELAKHLTDFVNFKDFINEKIEQNIENQSKINADIEAELSNRYTKEEANAEFVTEVELEAKGYLTEHQSLEGYAKESFVEQKIADLVDSAPEALNTLGELSEAIKNHEDEYDALLTVIGNKADKEHYHTSYALNGDFNDYKSWAESNYATKDHVAEEIAKAKLEGEEVDLSNYVTKDELSAKVDADYVDKKIADLVDSAPEALNTLSELATAINNHEEVYDALLDTVGNKANKEHEHDQYLTEHQSLEGYAKLTDIPSHEGLATEDFVKEEIKNIVIPEAYDDSELRNLIDGKAASDHVHDQYLTEDSQAITDLNNEVSVAYGIAEGAQIAADEAKDLANTAQSTADTAIATANQANAGITEVNQRIDNLNIPSIEGLASEQFVSDKIAEIELKEGPQGPQGIQGEPGKDGLDGKDGENGQSAYEIWLAADNTGTTDDFIASLKGDKGDNGLTTQIEVNEVIYNVDENGLIKLPKFVTPDELHEPYNDSELRNLITGKADSDHTHEEYSLVDHKHEEYLTEHQSLEHLALKEHKHDEYLTEHQSLEGYAKTADLFSKDYNDLTNKPEIPSIEGLASETYVQTEIGKIKFPETDLSNYYTKEEVDALLPVEEIEEVKTKVETVLLPKVEEEIEPTVSELKTWVENKEYLQEIDLAGYATETFVDEAIANIEIPEAEIYRVDFNAPDYAKAVEAYNNGNVLVLINAAPDINSYAIVNYVSEKYITFTKFLTSRSEAYGSFNTYYLSPANTWEVSKEVRLNKVEANPSEESTGDLTKVRIGKEVFTIPQAPSLAGYATEDFVNKKILEAEIADKEADLEAYYTKSEVDVKIPEVPTKVSELENDANYTNETKVLELIENNANTKIGIDFTPNITVGYLSSNTPITADMTIGQIIYKMLYCEHDWLPSTCGEPYFCDLCGHNHPTLITEHTLETYGENVDATCAQPGSSMGVKCGDCGEIIVPSEIIPRLPHEPSEPYLELEPTCTEAGETIIRCNNCGEYIDRSSVPALGHNYIKDETESTEATCDSTGLLVEICERCGDRKETTIEALGHNYTSKVTLEPACEEDGIRTYTCSNSCGESYTEAINKLGHKQAIREENRVEPDCTNDGSYEKVIYCTECNEVLSRETINLPALGHDYGDWVITKQPEVGVPGEQTKTCKRCDDIITEEIPALEPTTINYYLGGIGNHSKQDDPDLWWELEEGGYTSMNPATRAEFYFNEMQNNDTRSIEPASLVGQHELTWKLTTPTGLDEALSEVMEEDTYLEETDQVYPAIALPSNYKVSIWSTDAENAYPIVDVIGEIEMTNGYTVYYAKNDYPFNAVKTFFITIENK